ncbi:MAG: hypothetical protein IT182_04865 [Acidobacteria bacterium]|nr:hypothetical protein [Acidobacteriota bacterium]
MRERGAPLDGPLDLRDWFPPVETADWLAVIERDLKGADYESRLVWQTDEGIAVQPFHRAGGSPAVAPALGRSTTTPPISAETPPDAIRGDLLHDAGADAVQELAWSLADLVERLHRARTAGTPFDVAAGGITLAFGIGSAYFVEIAKLRAARLLWANVVAAFVGEDAVPPVRIHARTSRTNTGVYDTPPNLLRVTTEAMAAVIGGADGLEVEAHGFAPHLADNVPRILIEEAHLAAAPDAAAGSWFIEWLTDVLARKAWAHFQTIESAGGYTTAVEAGMLSCEVQATRDARIRAVATRRRTLVGVNDYPDLTPSGLPRRSAESAKAGRCPVPDARCPAEDALEPLRLAAPFEAIRARTERHAASTGRTPVVHLLTRIGDRRSRARAVFYLNLLGCAGMAITQGDALPERADLVILCSVDTDVHLDMPLDAVTTLTAWQDRLGMAP